MKVYIISDVHHFSTLDVFNGYKEGFKKLGIQYDVADMRHLLHYYSPDIAWGIAMAKGMNAEEDFTHVLVISGLSIPTWVVKSFHKRGMKIGVIALDDPHCSKHLIGLKDYYDYWFTNEKTMENVEDNIFYIPTATALEMPQFADGQVPPEFKKDIVFVGTIYPDRVKPLETICEWAEKNGKSVGIYGGLSSTIPEKSIIRNYYQKIIIPNDQTKLLYQNAKMVINLERNHKWNAATNDKYDNPWLVNPDKEPYTSNPRGYEIGLCKSLQFYVDARQSVKDNFGDNVIYANPDNIDKMLTKAFSLSEEERNKMVDNCHGLVVRNHTYAHRANDIVSILATK